MIVQILTKANAELDKKSSKNTIKELDWVIQSLTKENIFEFKLKEEFLVKKHNGKRCDTVYVGIFY